MNKKLKVLLWCFSVLVVIVVAGLFAANYAMDKVLSSLSTIPVADVTELEDTSKDSSDAKNADQDTEAIDAQAAEDNQDIGASQDNVTDSTEDSHNGKQQTYNVDDSKVVSSNPELDKIDTYSATVSEEKAKAIEDSVTLSEKTKVASTLLSSLSASDISTLQKLASGGLTVEEKKKAKEIMLEKLSEEQYDELIAIAAKYGVSQGKKYSEVKK